MGYFRPNPNNPDGISDFEADLKELTPAERVNAEIRMLKYHMAELKSIEMDTTLTVHKTIEDKLLELSEENN